MSSPEADADAVLVLAEPFAGDPCQIYDTHHVVRVCVWGGGKRVGSGIQSIKMKTHILTIYSKLYAVSLK